MNPPASQHAYPSAAHACAAQAVTDFFAHKADIDAVLLTCSCARGKATADSCLDFCILYPETVPAAQQKALSSEWEEFYAREKVFAVLHKVGAYSHVDLGFHDGVFGLPEHGWTSGADNFELEVGNYVAYSVPLWQRGDHYKRLKNKWLPYYPEPLRQERLAMVRRFCLNNLHHIPVYVRRKLYFQAFKRLYHAFEEFLQALFISRRVYPIAYDKWIHEQIVEILELPELYRELPMLLEINHFESDQIVEKGAHLEELLMQYVPA